KKSGETHQKSADQNKSADFSPSGSAGTTSPDFLKIVGETHQKSADQNKSADFLTGAAGASHLSNELAGNTAICPSWLSENQTAVTSLASISTPEPPFWGYLKALTQ
ncbi:MAG: hypothetical protein LBU62_07985, partial [Bacteroidales bacterium]|nr:hypothetical protein [Bacteroidales bacterium]